jgi:hypothetical protein
MAETNLGEGFTKQMTPAAAAATRGWRLYGPPNLLCD